MTYKVQKIRDEVERLYNQSLADENRQAELGLKSAACTSYGKSKVCKELLSFIDSLQEEPVSIDFEQELYKAFGQVKDFTLGMRIAKWFYDMGRKHQEPVSEDLEKAAADYEKNMWKAGHPEDTYTSTDIIRAVKFGANLQKQQMEAYRIEHCNSITNEQAELEQGFVDQHLDKHQRIPTFLDAIEYGMNLQKNKMMEDATDVTVHTAGDYPYIPQIELYDYDKDIPLAKEGDKVKIVVIRSEEDKV